MTRSALCSSWCVVGGTALVFAFLGSFACRSGDTAGGLFSRNVEGSDSVRLVHIATEALYQRVAPEDRGPYQVLRFARDTAGVLITLGPAVPPGQAVAGGG